MKKRTALSILYVLGFLVLHNYITNVVVGCSLYNFQVLSTAVQYALGAILFRYLFPRDRILISPFVLFSFPIIITAASAAWATVEDYPGNFFPLYFPFYLVVSFLIIWMVFGKQSRKANYIGTAAVLAMVAIAELLVLPYTNLTDNEQSAKRFKGMITPQFECQSVHHDTLSLPRRGEHYSILFISFIECMPCRHMIPFAEEVCMKLRSEDVDVFKINPVNTLEDVAEYEAAHKTGGCLTTLLPIDSAKFQRAIPIKSLPLMLVLNSSGQVLYSHLGFDVQERKLLFDRVSAIVKPKRPLVSN